MAEPSEIGIVTPYAGQVERYCDVIKKIQEDKPNDKRSALHIGTTELLQGKEAPYMIADPVRGSNHRPSSSSHSAPTAPISFCHR